MNFDPDRLFALTVGFFFLVATAADAQQPSELPVPERGLEEGTHTYLAEISMGGQQMTMNVTRRVEKVDEGWRVTERARGPMGEAVDTEILVAPSLTPVRRTMTQGPVRFELTYTDEAVDGTIAMHGNERKVEIDIDGPVFSDGAGAHLVIASLPLKEGYEARYRTLDLMTQNVRSMQLQVTGTESVPVPAGTFETFRVEIGSAAGDPGSTTLWIDRSSRQVVKTEAKIPQMGGATIVSELQAESSGDG